MERRGGGKTLIDELKLKNFRSHRDTVVSFSYSQGDSITVIIGENGAGKTSILDAISFALFKGKPSGVGMNELITLGKDETQVSLSFHSMGRKYRVERKRKIRGGSESFLYHVEDDGETLITTRERDVTDEVEKILGINGELFSNAVYIKQGEIDRLFTDDASLRKKHIGKLIGIEAVEEAYQNFFHILNHFNLKAEKLELIPDELEKKQEIKKAEVKEFENLKSEVKKVKKILAVSKKSVEKLEKRIGVLDDIGVKVEDKEKLSTESFYLQEKVKKIEEYEEQLNINEDGKKQAERVEKQIDALKEEVYLLEVVEERKKGFEFELNKINSQKTSLEQEIESLIQKGANVLSTKIIEIDDLEARKQKSISTLSNQIGEIEKKQENAFSVLTKKEALLASVKEVSTEISNAKRLCPVCSRELTSEHKENLIKMHSSEIGSLEKEIPKLAKSLETVKAELNVLKEKKERLSSLNTELIKEKKKMLNEAAENISFLIIKVDECKSKLKEKQSKIEEMASLKNKLDSLVPIRDRYNAALNFLRRESPEKEVIVVQIIKLKEKIKRLKNSVSKIAKTNKINLDSVLEDLRKAKDNYRVSREGLIEFEKKTSALESSLKHKETRIQELSDEISSLKELIKEQKSLKKFKSLLEKIRMVFHKDALQKELRIRARPLIEEYTREVFQSFNLPYSDISITDDYSIIVHGAGGDEHIDMLSGGERIAAALALRVGLSRALSGQKLELLILDEPTIHLDRERKRELVDIVKNLSLIPQTIVVTHDKEFEEAADRLIDVRKINGISQVV